MKSEVKPIATKVPNNNEEHEDIITERDLVAGVKEFNFPITFSEDDFKGNADDADEEIEHEEVKASKQSKPIRVFEKKECDKNSKKLRPVKFEREIVDEIEVLAPSRFTPSQIISPVYGIFNENKIKRQKARIKSSTPRISTPQEIDEIRKKAFGTLEDDILISIERPSTNDVEKLHLDPTTEALLEDLQNDKAKLTNVKNDDSGDLFDDLKEEKLEKNKKKLDVFDQLDLIYKKKEDK